MLLHIAAFIFMLLNPAPAPVDDYAGNFNDNVIINREYTDLTTNGVGNN